MRSRLVIVVVAVAGCASSAPPSRARVEATAKAPVVAAAPRPAPASTPHPDRVVAREVLAAIRSFTDEACACADAACVSAVKDRMSVWASPRLPRIQRLEPTPEENTAVEALQVRMRSCLTRLAPPVMPLTGAIVIGQLRDFKDQICACEDRGCVAAVQQQMLVWATDNLEAMKGLEPTEEESAAAARIDAELGTCIQRIEGSSRGW